MLDILRANARSALTYILFGIIIVVFIVSFGPGSCGPASRTGRLRGGGGVAGDAATVNGEKISAADFEQHYAQLYRAYQQQMGESFTRELAERLGLRRVAVDQLIERALVRQDAERKGLVVTDAELERAVKQIPAFQANGRFDYATYERAVSAAYGSAAQFEARMREDLAVQKMVALVRETAKVSDDEVREAFLSDNDRVDLEVVRFPVTAAEREVKVTPAEVDAYAAANADRVRKYYDEHHDRFDTPKRVKARHVLVKVDEGATQADADAAQKKAEDVAARARKGEDFAKLARDASDDAGSKDRGGDLGWFGPGVMAKPFEEAAFAAKAGDVVGPVRTRFGLHVIKVDEVQEPKKLSFDQAKADVARELLVAERAKAAAQAEASRALAAARGGKPLAELFPADDKHGKPVRWGGEVVRAEDTGLVPASSLGASVPHVGAAPELAKAALAAKGPQLLDRVFDAPGGPVVARVKERQRADPAQLAAKKGEYEQRLRAQRERQTEQAWVQALRQAASVHVNDQLAGGPGAIAAE